MIVSELITKLQAMPQDAIALARGYESGMDPIEDVAIVMCHHVPGNPGYEGEYQDNWLEKPGVVDDIQAVYIR